MNVTGVIFGFITQEHQEREQVTIQNNSIHALSFIERGSKYLLFVTDVCSFTTAFILFGTNLLASINQVPIR